MQQETMHLRRFVNFWIMVLVAAGLVSAPLVPVFIKPVTAAATDEMMAMAADTPCCPDQTKEKDCASCPFVALCMLGVSLPAPSGTGSLIQRDALRTAFAGADDLLIDGLDAKPPDHPPRTNV
jgi:hypothetical protein